MKKYIGSLDLLLFIFLCFLCGLIDAYCFLYRAQTFTLFQTGNLIKLIIFYVKGNISEASYSLILFVSFILFTFIFYFVSKLFKNLKISFKPIVLLICMILIIPSIVLKFNTINYISYQNIISGLCLSAIGGLIAISFKKVHLNKKRKIQFNAAMMTGNTKNMIMSLVNGIKYKNKNFLFESFCYFLMLTTFSIGILTTALIQNYVVLPNSLYINFGLIYLFLLLSLITMLTITINLKNIDAVGVNDKT
ncbi:YoaK family protein [Malacoplasma iowae]|uniref:Uncharacterized conserved protein, DUF1275 superfamily n=1 Tax=Malacoplasma iowae DK-CPA TaxID=1394179 RepID=A0A084U3S2_MALIO|nr:YoaK family protein [Malacoplasma iowae]KFB07608.1 uncharacterized conserved protein, DUF1275 superfamily [Malacoplasma iowae DK-CPA]WPL36693.1 YoaK family protein [Malacoplasma iowae]WPL37911.1 YoaK family protein [Malacoplasma iowae]WPL41309.1 YoaK family protein [Malacoplasma iowae]